MEEINAPVMRICSVIFVFFAVKSSLMRSLLSD